MQSLADSQNKISKKVSVIIASYNKRAYLRQAIASVLTQTLQNWQLIVIDDCSIDGSFAEALEWQNLGDILLLRTNLAKHGANDNGICRFAHNINLAYKQAIGEYITYLADDDFFLPWRLEMMARCLDFDKEMHVVYGQQQILQESEGSWLMGKVRKTVGVTLHGEQQIDHSSVMHTRECFEKVGGWDEQAPMRYGDAYFWEKLNKAGYLFYPIPLVMDVHRYHHLSYTYSLDHPEEKLNNCVIAQS